MSDLPPPPPPSAGGTDPKSARADAKAAKARAKAMRPWYRKKRFWLLGLIVLVIAGAALGGGGDDDEPSAGRGANNSADDGGSTEDEYAVGETAKSGDFEITLHTVEDPFQGGEFEEPEAGNRFVGVEVEVRNTSDERQTISTLMGAEIIDSENRAYNITLAGLDRPQLDGDVPAGSSRRGWVVFEVPDNATNLKFRLKGNVTAQGSLFVL